MAIQINKNEEIWLIWKKNYFKENGRHYTAELSSHIECTGRFTFRNGSIRFQGNCPPTPPHNPTFCPNWNTNVDVELARGRWAVSSKPKLIPKGFCYNSVALKHGWGRLFFGWTTFTFGLRQDSEQDFRISLCLFTSFSRGLWCGKTFHKPKSQKKIYVKDEFVCKLVNTC